MTKRGRTNSITYTLPAHYFHMKKYLTPEERAAKVQAMTRDKESIKQ